MTTKKTHVFSLLLFFCCSLFVTQNFAQQWESGPTFSACPGSEISSDQAVVVEFDAPGVGVYGVDFRLASVLLDVDHNHVADLDITLTSPNGMVLDLTSDNGGAGTAYDNTILKDDAMTSIVMASAPFAGEFKPENALTSFNGEGTSGSWTLTINDDFSLDNGTANCFELRWERAAGAQAFACPPDTVEVPIVGPGCEATVDYAALFSGVEIDTVVVNSGPADGTGLVQGDFLDADISVTDVDGNMLDCQFVITAVDITAPQLECPGDVAVETCDEYDPGSAHPSPLAPVLASDNCPATLSYTVTAGGTEVEGGVGIPQGPFVPGEYEICYTLEEASDDDGNGVWAASCCFNLSVTVPAPSLECPSDLSVDADSCTWESDESIFLVSSDGDCDFDVNYTIVDSNGDTLASGMGGEAAATFDLGTYEVCYTVPGEATPTPGANASGSPEVAWGTESSTAPRAVETFTAPVSGTYGTDFVISGIDLEFTHTWSGDIRVEIVSPAGTAVEVMDAAGDNSDFVNYVVELEDGGADQPTTSQTGINWPLLSGPFAAGDATLFNNFVAVELATVWAGEAIDGDWTINVYDDAGGDAGTWHAYEVSFAPAGAADQASCCFNVTVEDADAPEVTCPPSEITFDDEQDGEENCVHLMGSTALDPVSSDVCGDVSATHDFADAPDNTTLVGAIFPQGETVVTWTITDESGNESECVITITVVNTTPPVLDCPKDWTITLDPGQCEYIFNYEISVEDGCAGDISAAFSPNNVDPAACNSALITNSLGCLVENMRFGILYDVSDLSNGENEILVESIDRGYWTAFSDFVIFRAYDASAGVNSSMPLLGEVNITQTAVFTCANTPLGFIAPAGVTDILVETEYGAGFNFVGGQNSTDPSDLQLPCFYICGTPDWTPISDLPFATFHNVEAVNFVGLEADAPVLEQTAGEPSGTSLGIGGPYDFGYTATDESGNTSSCSWTITIEEYPNPISELACNDHINLSLNAECSATVTADLILEGGPYGCYDDYIVTITDDAGNSYSPELDGSAVGVDLTVMVTDPETGNTCWGTLTVEDKIGPSVLCADITIGCDDEIPTEPAPEADSALAVLSAGNGEEISNTLDPVVFEFDVDFGRPGVTVADVNVVIDLEHTWVGDLDIEIESPSGTTSKVWDNFCGTTDNLNYIADDEGDEEGLCVEYNSSGRRLMFPGLIPNPTFDVFDGEEASGTWKLTIEDAVGGDDGTVNAVAIELSYDADQVLPTDACGGVELVSEIISDEGMICTGDFIRIIQRQWTATDGQGASQSCIQTIFVERPTVDELAVPSNFDDIDEPALECGDCTTPDCTGEPGGNLCTNFQYTFKDHILPICAGSYTIVRKWKILDMCTSTIVEHDQIIKVLDSTGPDVICPFNDDVNDPRDESSEDNVLEIQASVFECVGIFTVDLPRIVDACAETNASSFDIDLAGPAGVDITFVGAGFIVSGAPLGEHTFTYLVTDECGNVTTCDFTVIVIDKVPPTPVCDENTEVSLTSDGTARVFAPTFDDGSHDNCSPVVWFKVIRSEELCGTNNGFTGIFNQCLVCGGLNANDGDDDPSRVGVQVYFDDYVEFCCEDVGREDIEVTLRVFDVDPGEGPVDPSRMVEGGDLWCHFNDCVVNIDVQDKLPPFVSCPADLFFDCNEELDDEALNDVNNPLYGIATVVGICEPTINVSVSYSIECGEGVVTRTFTAMSNNGATSTCQQRIFLTNGDPFYINDVVCPGEPGWDRNDGVDWPCDVLLTDVCADAITDDPSVTGEPVLFGDACSDLLVSYDDELFTRDDDACLKILRTWKVLDWCQYDELTGAGQWTYVQVIKLDNQVAPEFEGCEDIVQCDSAAAGCESFVTLVVNATDDCTDSSAITYGYQIDAFYDPNTSFEVDFFGSGNDASGSYPFGKHLIRWTATDGCGNTTTCEYEFDLQDCKKPSPKCFSGLVTVIMESVGDVTIWASDFDAGSDDNCGGYTVSFSEDVNDIFRTFTCEDISAPVTLPIWFTDEAGNQDFCETFIIIQDNNGACGDSLSADIMGIAVTEPGDGVEGVDVTLSNESINLTQDQITDLGGEYVFWNNPLLMDYTLEAYSNDDPKNGISTLDIVKIQQHLLGLDRFDSPYQSVAADVNNSQSVSALDMVELRKLLLGVYDEFPNNTSWRFIDETQTFGDIFNPWPLDETVEVADLSSDMIGEDFVAVKVGDLNNSASPNALVETEDRTDDGVLTFVAEQAKLTAGATHTVAVTAENFDAVLGYQFTLNFSSNLEFAGFESGAIELSELNFGLNRLDQGIVTTSWNDANGVTVASDEVLFTMSFNVKSAGLLSDMITVGSQVTTAEAYSRTSENLGATIEFRSETGDVVENFEVLQNVPNPFDKETVIGFTLPQDAEVTFTIYDVNGKSVFMNVREYEKGYNQITVDRADLNASGVVHYTLETAEFTATKKMILID